MKILIYGAGVQGSYLAHALVSNGNDVTIIARGKRAIEIEENGIVIRHYLQRKTTIDKVKVINRLNENDYYDIIFVTMKYTDFPSVLDSLSQNISNNIVLVGNNLTASEMQDYIEKNSITKKNIAFAFQLTGGKRELNRMICIRFGKGEMIIGSLKGDIVFNEILEKLFNESNYQLTYEKNIDHWLKSHTIIIMAMNSAAYIHDNKFKNVAKDKKLLKQMVEAMDEGFTTLQELGYEVIPKSQATFVKKYKFIAYVGFKIYHYSPMTKLIDGSFAEIIGLLSSFDKLKEKSKYQTPNFNNIKREAILKYSNEHGIN